MSPGKEQIRFRPRQIILIKRSFEFSSGAHPQPVDARESLSVSLINIPNFGICAEDHHLLRKLTPSLHSGPHLPL